MKGRPGFTPSCGDCRYFRKLPETAAYVSSSDGMCCHPTRNGKNRKTPYLAYSRAAACFDGEDKDEEYDGQLRLDVEGGGKRMRDTISREAALKLILSGRVGDDSHFECPAECNSMLEWAANEVAKMPAADVPDRKVGKWIPLDELDDDPSEVWECDQCGYVYGEMSSWTPPYCPNCGAKNGMGWKDV